MVEAMTSPPTTDMSLEGFFMNTVAIDSNVQLIPALRLHRLSSSCIKSYEKNITNRKSPEKLKLAKQKQRKIPAVHQVRQVSSTKINLKLKNVKVLLKKSSSCAYRKTNLDENDVVFTISSPDLALLRGKKCLTDTINDTNVGNYGLENKRRKSADTGTELIEESSERLTSKNKEQTTEIVSKKTQNTDTRRTSTRAHSKRKESVQNTQDTKKRENENNKQEESKIEVIRSKRINKASSKNVSNESEETVDNGKVEEKPQKPSTERNSRKRRSDGTAAIGTNQEREKLNETSKKNVEETFDHDFNNSMILRASRRYYCILNTSDDSMDETWEIPSKKSKKPKKPGKKNTQEKRERKPKEKKEEKTDEKGAKKPEKENTEEKRGRKPKGKKEENTDEKGAKKPEKENTQEKGGRNPNEKKEESTGERGVKKPEKEKMQEKRGRKPAEKKKEKENTEEKHGRKPKEKKEENTDEKGAKKPEKENTQEKGGRNTNEKKEESTGERGVKKPEKEKRQEKRGRKPAEKKKENMDEKGAKNPKENSTMNVNKGSDESKRKRKNNKKETEENGNSSKVENKNSVAQVIEKAIPKPEECVVTARRGTLKYLKQREVYVQALAKEAQAEDDFFSTKDFGKQRKVNQLLLGDSQDDTLTIKTPQGKGSGSPDGVITPRTSLLGQWGVTEQTNTAYTPSTSSPKRDVSSVDKKVIMDTIYHQLKSREGRPRGFRKNLNNSELAFESILKNPLKAPNINLPTLPEINEADSSHEDEYFDTSDEF